METESETGVKNVTPFCSQPAIKKTNSVFFRTRGGICYSFWKCKILWWWPDLLAAFIRAVDPSPPSLRSNRKLTTFLREALSFLSRFEVCSRRSWTHSRWPSSEARCKAGEPTNFCWHSDFVVLKAVQGGKKFGLKSKRTWTVSLWPLKQATSNAVMPLRGSLKINNIFFRH